MIEKYLKHFYLITTLIFSFSFLSYFDVVYNSDLSLNNFFFLLILLTSAYFIYKDYKNALYFILLDLVLNSKGYLFDWKFSTSPDDFRISYRIALFIIIFIFSLWDLYKRRKIHLFEKKYRFFLFLLLSFAFFIVLASFQAYFLDIPLSLIFADVNAYFYYFYFVVIWNIFSRFEKKDWQMLLVFLKKTFIFLSSFTLFLFYVFTQLYISWMRPLYKWVRDGRLGEITRLSMNSSLHRVFFQSHIYLVLAWFALLFIFLMNYRSFDFQKKNLTSSFLFISLTATILISASRSFWLAAFLAFILMISYFIYLKKFDYLKKSILYALKASFYAFLLIFILFSLNLHLGRGHEGSLDLLQERLKKEDPAINTRWNQLSVLWESIEKRPLLGYGFGKELVYQSEDPRVRNEINSSGKYKTYAFEWGYLDIILKMGFLGLFSYLIWIFYLLYKIYKRLAENFNFLYLFYFLTIIYLLIVHIFTPYLNHPLGIAILIIISYLALNPQIYAYQQE